MRALLGALVDRALERLPLEPNLHAKRDLGRHAHEDAQALDALGGPADDGPADGDLLALARTRVPADEVQARALALLIRRHERRPAPALVFFTTDAVPARDPFIELGPGPPSPLNDALILAEAAASTALEAATWETKLRLIGVAAAQLDRTAEIEAGLDAPWGTDPVDTSGYERLMALRLGDRVEQLLREGARGDEDPTL